MTTLAQMPLWRAETASERREARDGLSVRCAAFGWRLERADDGRLWLYGNGAPAVFGREASLEEWLAVQERRGR